MSYWEGPTRWINTILLIIVGFIGFDALFRILEANTSNVIVGVVADIADYFLAPFEGMFPDQEIYLTALIAVLGYSLAAGILLALIRALQASRPSNIRRSRVYNEDHGPYVHEDRRTPRADDRPDPSSDRTRVIAEEPTANVAPPPNRQGAEDEPTRLVDRQRQRERRTAGD